jgi:hypothetical protein
MSSLVYFDTNVFDNLIKQTGGVTEADEERLQATVSSSQLRILVSDINLRETLAALRSRPEIACAQLRLIGRLADWDRFVRFSSQILEDDIRHFAFNGERANTPFEVNQYANDIQSVVQLIVDGSVGLEEFEAVIGEDRDQKRAFLDSVKKSRADTAGVLEEYRKANAMPNFEQFFEAGVEGCVLAFIQSFGVAEECKRRGLDKLLRIPSIRAFFGLGMSLMYRISVEQKAPKSSDSRDIQHAVCAAAAADVFVTHDEELTFRLRRVSIKGLRVLRLRQLLEDMTETQAQLNYSNFTG